MKKFLFVTVFFATVNFAGAQVDSLETIAKTAVDGAVSDKDSLSIALDAIVNFYIAVKKVSGADPSTQDGATALWKTLSESFGALLPVLLWLITAAFKFLKKDPKAAATLVGKVAGIFRTKWVVAVLAALIGATWSLFFREGQFDFDAISLTGSVVFTFFAGIGIENFRANWIKKK